MSSVRVPASLRRTFARKAEPAARKPEPVARKEMTTLGAFAAACLMAASPTAIAVAQEPPAKKEGTLPPLKVETKQAKKK
jgi:hypothetical protein